MTIPEISISETAAILILLIEGLCALLLLHRSGVLKSRASWLLSILLLVLALGLRAAVFDYETLDYQNFLSRWVEHFRRFGGFSALRDDIGNYNIPYLYFLALFSLLPMKDLYLIKLLSTASDLLMAWAVLLLCRRFTKSRVLLSSSTAPSGDSATACIPRRCCWASGVPWKIGRGNR